MAYRVTFWGTRGSIPTPGRLTSRYGGNTPCVAVEPLRETPGSVVILDAGTGIRPLGSILARRADGGLEVDLLLSHTHWDHIQGLPFFAPLFNGGSTIRIRGPRQGETELETILRSQMDPVVFPVPLEDLAATINVTHVEEDHFLAGGFEVTAMPLRHPSRTLGYRISPRGGGASFAYVTDNELVGGSYEVDGSWYGDFVRFLQGVDLLVHDAMYTPSEAQRFRGWGHSSYGEAVALAEEAGVKQLVLFHHSPEHDDDAMDDVVEAARALAGRTAHPVDVVAATEGLELTL